MKYINYLSCFSLNYLKINKIYLDKQPLDEIGPGDFAKTL